MGNTTGSNNIVVGQFAGFNLTSGSDNIYLGAVNAAAPATESKTMRLGEGQTSTFVAGIAGTPLSGSQVVVTSTGQLGIIGSSSRFKRDTQAMGQRSLGLLQLRPVTFRYKQDPKGTRQYGLIAEDVAKVYPELVTRGSNGEMQSVQYHELVPMLLNELQRQEREPPGAEDAECGLGGALGAAGPGRSLFRFAGKSLSATASVRLPAAVSALCVGDFGPPARAVANCY